jgi:predicted acyl esterase
VVQPGALPDAQLIAQRNAIEKELQSVAIVERKLMIPMRDGKRMATDVYRPKDTSKKYPIIFVRTPYNFNFWDVRNGAPRDLTNELEAVKRGYAFVEMNERGHFFSEAIMTSVRPHRWVGRHLVDVSAMVEWQGRHHWMLLHR